MPQKVNKINSKMQLTIKAKVRILNIGVEPPKKTFQNLKSLLWLGLRNLIRNPSNYIKALEGLNVNILKSLANGDEA